jgi:hypothetical protein
MKRCLGWCTIALLSLSAVTCGDSPSAPNPVPTATDPPPTSTPPPPPPPPATQIISGTVRAVDGGPIEGATVFVPGMNRIAATSDSDGRFTIRDVTANLIYVNKPPDFVGTAWPVPPGSEVKVDAKVQPRLIVAKGTTVSSSVAADDLTYSGEYEDAYWESTYRCSSCKQIWLANYPAGAVQVRLRWSGSLPLDLWVGRHYEGLQRVVHGAPGLSELTVESADADTLLVGIDALARPGLTVTTPVSFEISVK